MWFSTAEHFKVMLYSLIIGIFLGILYDFVKMSRILLGVSTYSHTGKKLNAISLPFIKKRAPTVKHKNSSVYAMVMLFIGDIVFSLICAGVYSVFLFHAIRGQVRWYFLLSSALGFFLYYFTFSKLTVVIIEIFFFVFKTILLYLKLLLLLPFKLIYRLAKAIISAVYSSIVSPMTTNIVYNKRKKYTEKRRNRLGSEIQIQEF